MADVVHEALDRVVREVAVRAERLWEVALALHADPEYAFEEHRAARLLSGELETHRRSAAHRRDRDGPGVTHRHHPRDESVLGVVEISFSVGETGHDLDAVGHRPPVERTDRTDPPRRGRPPCRSPRHP